MNAVLRWKLALATASLVFSAPTWAAEGGTHGGGGGTIPLGEAMDRQHAAINAPSEFCSATWEFVEFAAVEQIRFERSLLPGKGAPLLPLADLVRMATRFCRVEGSIEVVHHVLIDPRSGREVPVLNNSPTAPGTEKLTIHAEALLAEFKKNEAEQKAYKNTGLTAHELLCLLSGQVADGEKFADFDYGNSADITTRLASEYRFFEEFIPKPVALTTEATEKQWSRYNYPELKELFQLPYQDLLKAVFFTELRRCNDRVHFNTYEFSRPNSRRTQGLGAYLCLSIAGIPSLAAKRNGNPYWHPTLSDALGGEFRAYQFTGIRKLIQLNRVLNPEVAADHGTAMLMLLVKSRMIEDGSMKTHLLGKKKVDVTALDRQYAGWMKDFNVLSELDTAVRSIPKSEELAEQPSPKNTP